MPAARLLDLTRLVSRLGRGALTGVDRVELAYLDHFIAGDAHQGLPLFGLVRTAWGHLLLDGRGAAGVAALAHGQQPLRRASGIARLLGRKDPLRAAAESTVRQLALRAAPDLALPVLLRHLPPGTVYFNTGHANLSARRLAALGRAGLRRAVLVHDVIPLDHPEYTRPGIPAVFARKMAAVAHHADLVIHTTRDARQRTEAQLARLGRVPPGIVAPLGITLAAAAPVALPGFDPSRPWFIAIGTIEPRKNHAFLLDLWQTLASRLPPDRLPQLIIAGGRGWNNDAVFRRLDTRPPGVIEAQGLPDGALSSLLQGARALLFPSFAEGFGLPPAEAAALGCPVIANPLPVLQEILGDYPVYLPVHDDYAWLETIMQAAVKPPEQAGRRWQPPDWGQHFNAVLNSI